MGYRRGSIYYFDTATSTGIDKVPVGYQIILRDTAKSYLVNDITGLTGTSTVQDAIDGGKLEITGGAGATLAPTLSTDTVSMNEGSSVNVTITNYDEAITYVVESTNEAVATVTRVGDTLTIVGQDVAADSTATVRINAAVTGVAASEWVEVAVTVLFVNSEADAAIVNADMGTNATLTSFTDQADGILATADNAVYLENIQEQDALDGDWIEFNNTTINYMPKEYCTVEADSTSTALKSFNELTEGDEVRLYNSTDGVVSGSLGSVTTTGTNSVNVHDIFGDGSAIATYNLDGNANDLSGAYNGTATNVTYATGKYGSNIVFNGTNGYFTFPSGVFTTNVQFSFSCWVKKADTSISSRIISLRHAHSIEIFTSNSKYNIGGVAGTATISNNTWYFLAFTATSSASTLYVYNEAGTLIDTIVNNANLLGASNFSADWLGRNDTTYYQSEIDQVRIFNRALTQEEVTALYNEQGTKYTADISSFSLTQAPTKAYIDDLPKVYIDCAGTVGEIDMTANGVELTNVSDTYDGTKFTAVYADHDEQCRAVQRKVTANNGTKLLDGFSTETVKLGS